MIYRLNSFPQDDDDDDEDDDDDDDAGPKTTIIIPINDEGLHTIILPVMFSMEESLALILDLDSLGYKK